MRRLLPLTAALATVTAPQALAAPVPGSDGVTEAAYFAGARPTIAFVRGRDLFAGSRDADWTIERRASLPDTSGRVAAVRAGFALVESRIGGWLRFYAAAGGRWRSVRIADAPKDAQLGPAGMTLSRRGRPVIAYAVRRRDQSTELWLAEVRPNLRVARTRVTRRGFPASAVPPAATPVLMPNGTIRIVQTFSQRGANAIFWRRERERWWGRVLYASALGTSAFPFFTGLLGEDLYLAWTIAYPTESELHLVLTSRTTRSRSRVLHTNAVVAGLGVSPDGIEVAANESVAGLTAGLITVQPLAADVIFAGAPVELDGKILAYHRHRHGWHVLLARSGQMEWFLTRYLPQTRIVHLGGLAGRIEGASGGTVQVYREVQGQPRTLLAEAPVSADGTFSAADPAPVSGSRYRFVYEADLPYSLLVREPVP